MTTLNPSTVLIKNPDYSTTVLPDGKWLFFESDSNKVVVVSPTAGVFWEHCTGDLSLSEILSGIAELYPDTDKKAIEQDVYNIAPMLIKRNLLHTVESNKTNQEEYHGDLSNESSANAT